MAFCPYVNKHLFCPKCGRDRPTVCIQDLEVIEHSEEPVEPLTNHKFVPIAETVDFAPKKPRGRPTMRSKK